MLSESTNEALELGPARVETCPVVQVEVPVVREEVDILGAESMLTYRLVVGINRAVHEIEFLRAYLIS